MQDYAKETLTNPRRLKGERRKYKKKNRVILGISLALMAGIISVGVYYKDILPIKQDTQHVKQVVQGEDTNEAKQDKRQRVEENMYMVKVMVLIFVKKRVLVAKS